MKVSRGFIVATVTLAVIGGALIVAVQNGTVEEWLAARQSQAAFGKPKDDLMESITAKFENSVPRLHPDTSLDEAFKKYSHARDPKDRTLLAYDLISAKFARDLHDGAGLTPAQQSIYDNAGAYVKWIADMIVRAINNIPDEQLADMRVFVQGRPEPLSPRVTKELLAQSLATTRGACNADKLTNLKKNYSTEFLAVNLVDYAKVFWILELKLQSQAMNKARPAILSASTGESRAAIEAFFSLRNTVGNPEQKTNDEHDDKILDTFFSEGHREKAFEIYGYAPECFRASEIMTLVKAQKYMQTDAKANYYLQRIQEYYKKTGKIPEDLTPLRPQNPETKIEKFYALSKDGWYRDFEIVVEKNHIQIKSTGPDGKPGTPDDFVAAEGPLSSVL